MGEEDKSIRIDERVHRLVKIAAAAAGVSIEAWCASVLEQAANEVIAKLTSAAHEQQRKK